MAGLRISPRLGAIPRYEPGLTTAEVLARHGLERAVKLASNESPFPPLPEVARVVQAGLADLNRYPDGAARALRRALADRHGVGPEQVVVGNGSCELIMLAGQALLDPGASVIHADPSFAMYPHLGSAAGAQAVAVPLASDGGHDLEAMAAAVDERTRLLIVCNPNNPTGVYRPAADVERLLDAVPADLPVLVDEAYFDFVDAPDADGVMAMARERGNLLVTRTFSKAYGLCGLRVGYGVGGPRWVAALDQVRQPFNTNALAQAAALESLAHPQAIAERAKLIVSERRRVSRELARAGWGFTPSRTNFILLDRGPDETPDGPVLHERLLRRGVIVRDGAALGCAGRIRVSIGAPDENTAFLTALAELCAPLPHPGPGRTSP
ncbi:MAG: histidinol-phosphate aminotransferase [Miltoncostaeaceae bacterium]|nr:histidinol-phosphate aminotransferase [Miltoncostaeaceae bacterium]